jgi:hypothetical protein
MTPAKAQVRAGERGRGDWGQGPRGEITSESQLLITLHWKGMAPHESESDGDMFFFVHLVLEVFVLCRYLGKIPNNL